MRPSESFVAFSEIKVSVDMQNSEVFVPATQGFNETIGAGMQSVNDPKALLFAG